MARYTFLTDGYTHELKVMRRGEMLDIDTEKYPHFLWDADEQMQAYGKVHFKKGAWDGPLFDVEDPTLSEKDKEKLVEANAAIVAAREEEATQEPEEPAGVKPPTPKRRPRAKTTVNVPQSS